MREFFVATDLVVPPLIGSEKYMINRVCFQVESHMSAGVKIGHSAPRERCAAAE
jgi:hypothetical protein